MFDDPTFLRIYSVDFSGATPCTGEASCECVDCLGAEMRPETELDFS